MKRKLLLLTVALLCSVAVQTARAAAVDYLTGWTEVTSLPTDNAELSKYYYVFVATEADLMLAQEYGIGKISDEAKPQENELTVVYRTPSNPLIAKKFVWMLSYDATFLYGIRNLNNSTLYMQSREGLPWRVQFRWETAQSKWTRWNLAYAAGSWTIENNACMNASEDTYFSEQYIGPWLAKAFADNNVAAGNKTGENVGKFKIYRISRQDFKAPTDVTSTYLTNPGFDDDDKTVDDSNVLKEFVTNWKSVRIEYARYGIYNSSKASDGTYDKWGVSTASDGKYYLRIRNNYNAHNETQNIQQNAAMTLPKGNYNISFDYKVARRTSTSLNLTVSAKAGSTTKGSKVIAIPQVAANTSYFSSIGWTKGDFDFTLDNSTGIIIDITCKTLGETEGATAALLDNFVVNYYNINGPNLIALIAQATSINSETGDLTSAIAAAQAVYDGINNTPAYQSTIDDAITTLKGAITTSVAGISMSHGDDLSYLIANAGFEGISAITANQATNTTIDYSSDGWLALSTATSNSCGAVVAYGSDKTLNGVTAPSADNNGNSGKALGISIGWSATVAYQTAPITLPAGKYRMSVQGFNNNSDGTSFTSKFGFVPTAGGGSLSIKNSYTYNTWEKDELIFTLAAATEGVFQIGGQAGNNTSTTHAKVFLDNITLTYVTDLGLAKEAWEAAKAAAEEAYASGTYANVTGSEKTALKTEIDKAEPSTKDGYDTAKSNLESTTAAFTAVKETYDEYAQESVVATVLGVSVPAITSSTTASDLIPNMQAMNVSEYSEATSNYTFNATDLLGDWSNAPGNKNGESWDDTTGDTYYDEWNASSRAMAQTVTLPKAKYVLIAKGRASTGGRLTLSDGTNTITFPHKGNSGKGIETDGTPNFGDGTYANSNNGRGWEYRFLTFESDGSTSTTLTFNWTTASSNWAGLDDITLLAIPETVELDEDDEYTPVYTIANVTLSRSIAANTWSTFVVPFDIDNTTLEDQFGDDVRVSTFSADDKNGVTFTPMVEPAIEANVPVLLRTTAAKSSFTFNGVTIKEGEPTFSAAGVNFVGNYAGEITIPNTLDTYYVKSNALKKSTGKQKLLGFRAYFTVEADSGVKAFFENGFNFDDADAISDVRNKMEDGISEIFNLAGQKMSKLQKGVNIVNGKKVLVK